MDIQQIPILVVYVILPFAVATIIAFTVKEYTKMIGIGIIILALYTRWALYNITGYFIIAVIGFGLFLAAGILTILYEARLNVPA
jgi:hypothetical protein